MRRRFASLRPGINARAVPWLIAAALVAAPAAVAGGRETPKSYGPASLVDTPVLRLPKRAEPPEIDGELSAGEWRDAAALTAFWADFVDRGERFRFLAPAPIQLRVYGAWDAKNLYLAVRARRHPPEAWLRARGRFPDVLDHPQYGIRHDDHVSLELRPVPGLREGFRRGVFRLDANATATLGDAYWSPEHGLRRRWRSGARVRSRVRDDAWTIEYRIPFASLKYGGYRGADESGDPHVSLPPSAGTVLRAWFRRRAAGGGAYPQAFDGHGARTTRTKLVLDASAPSVQVRRIGPVMADRIDLEMTVKNDADRSKAIRVGFFVENDTETIFSSYDAESLSDGVLELKPGESRTIAFHKDTAGITERGNALWFDVRAAGDPAKLLFRTRVTPFHTMTGMTIMKDHAVRGPVVEREPPWR